MLKYKAPILVSRELVKQMRPGSVIFDVALDQCGCVETLYSTSHTNPIYIDEEVVHSSSAIGISRFGKLKRRDTKFRLGLFSPNC